MGKKMKPKWIYGIAAAAAVLVIGALAPASSLDSVGGSLSEFVGVRAAEAAPPPGAGRRAVRRTTRRVVRRNSIAGCTPWNAYWNCGGVYYRPVVEKGVTVYVVVNP
ncbi:MAG: hypothetical protein C0606_05440 [Hyphomicrobiales bacterium]|nr:MAG: hypothetical protein C0606_05440 [Hyphomicrobiales bacterium]